VRRRGGQKVFREAQRRYHLAGKAGLVPVVVVGNEALSGKQAIAAGLPALLARLVAGEGAPLPPLAGLQQVIEGTADQTAVAAGGGGVVGVLSRMGERFNADRVGNGLAVGVLLVMLAILLQTLARLGRAAGPGVGARPGWAVLPVALAGVGVSAYLAFVETTGTSAICGPVGNCNTVQQSIYSHIFGVPLGVAGTIGYLLIALSWVMARRERPSARLASVALLALSLAGMGFSIYLTFLEPFVIGATCVWCLGSASLMTLLVLLTRGPGAAVLRCEV